MADQSVRGRFVWHELMTPDSSAAHAFYSKTIGWKSQPWEEDSSYVMFAAPRGPIGATVGTSGDASPQWLPYVGTGDIEKTVELAQEKGGSIVKQIDTLSSGSKYAVLSDPYGASFGVYESADDYGQITDPQPGEHSWHELMSTDHAGAFEFYSELFGWQKITEHDMGPMGTYLIWGLKGRQLGGMMKTMEGGPGPSWVSYVHVKDVNQIAKKAKSAGGTIVNGPMEVPGGDWIVQVIDPQGAMFAAHATAANMKKLGEPKKKSKAKLAAAENPAPMEDPEVTPPAEEAPPAQKAPEEKAPAKKAPSKKAPAKQAPADEAPAEQAPAKQAPAKKAPAKKSPAKQAPAKKSPAKSPAKKKAGKKAGKKKGSASKGAGSKKTAAKKGAKKGASKASKKVKQTRSGGKKKAAKKPRKGK